MGKVLILFVMLFGCSQAAFAITYNNLKCRYTDREQVNDEQGWYVQIDGSLEVIDVATAKLASTSSAIRYSAEVVDGKIAIDDLDSYQTEMKTVDNIKDYKGDKYKNHFMFPAFYFGGDFRGNLIIEKAPKIVERKTPFGFNETVYIFSSVLDVSYDDHHGDYIEMNCEAFWTNDER